MKFGPQFISLALWTVRLRPVIMAVMINDNIAKALRFHYCDVWFICVILLHTCQDALDGKQGQIFLIGNEKLVKSSFLRSFLVSIPSRFFFVSIVSLRWRDVRILSS